MLGGESRLQGQQQSRTQPPAAQPAAAQQLAMSPALQRMQALVEALLVVKAPDVVKDLPQAPAALPGAAAHRDGHGGRLCKRRGRGGRCGSGCRLDVAGGPDEAGFRRAEHRRPRSSWRSLRSTGRR